MISTGLARVCADPGLLGPSWPAARFGLVTNHGGVLPDLTPSAVALRAAGVPLVALFGPEHGLHGTAQAGGGESSTVDSDTGLPVYNTYGVSRAALDEMVSTVDVVLCDVPDAGTRCYTYVWTMADLMGAAARTGRRFVVLDRPNPIGGVAVEGPVLDPAYTSFVGRMPVPLRHGLTVAELARWLARDRRVSLTVVAMTGWQRHLYGDETGLEWVMPSVNLPTVDTAVVYPGAVLFEGTNLSEGRGTTRPFELIGAPYVDGRWVAALRSAGLPGVAFRDVRFTPMFGKHAGTVVRGVQLHVTDRSAFAPVAVVLEMLRLLRALYPVEFGWRPAGQDGRHHIDLLWGSDNLRRAVDADADPAELLAAAPKDVSWAGDALLYE